MPADLTDTQGPLASSALLLEFQRAAEEIAKQAGAVSRAAFYAPKRVESKAHAQDLVTETDRAVENLIRALLHERFPEHQFVGEETHVAGSGIPDGPTWIVDPIDGTTNFVHGLPLFCVSIGLCMGRGEPVLGVVYNPISEELFSAARGHGATLNGQPISVSKTATTLERSLIVSEFTGREEAEGTVRDALRLMQHVRSIRMFGTAALDLCFTACGRVDGFVEKGIKCWDICAGTVVLREAGGYATDFSGAQPFDLYKGECVAAASQAVAEQIVALLAPSH